MLFFNGKLSPPCLTNPEEDPAHQTARRYRTAGAYGSLSLVIQTISSSTVIGTPQPPLLLPCGLPPGGKFSHPPCKSMGRMQDGKEIQECSLFQESIPSLPGSRRRTSTQNTLKPFLSLEALGERKATESEGGREEGSCPETEEQHG